MNPAATRVDKKIKSRPAFYRSESLIISILFFIKKLWKQRGKEIIKGYSLVWFSEKTIVGLIFFITSFIVANVGLSGLVSIATASLFASFTVLDSNKRLKKNIYYNTLLTGLALGFTYRINFPLLIILPLASILTMLITVSLTKIYDNFLGIPVLALPFVISSWIILSGAELFNGLTFTISPFETEIISQSLPFSMEIILRSLGASFFQFSLLGGILISIGILIYSRHGFLLSVTGIFTAMLFYSLLGLDLKGINIFWTGFNFALTSIAVGGIFLVPSLFSFITALISSMVTAIIFSASIVILKKFELPILAFPFVFSTQIIIYSLKSLFNNQIRPFSFVEYPMETPEENLKYFKNRRASFINSKTPFFYLPVSGEWRVTQGFNGKITHRDEWAHAIDFEITDQSGNKFSGSGKEIQDYYSWNIPVFAPADGRIVKVISSINDNSPGEVNTREKFGNTIIIAHSGGIFSSLSHLAKDSPLVKEGENVQRGQLIARVGNTGRSPYPHLHFQVQLTQAVGGFTIPFEFINFFTKKDGSKPSYISNGIPDENAVVCSAVRNESLASALSFPQDSSYRFLVKNQEKSWIETWKSTVDFSGKRFLFCSEKNSYLYFYTTAHELVLINYKGESGTGLETFFLAAPIIPFSNDKGEIIEKLPPEILLKGCEKAIYNFAEPFFETAKLKSYTSLLQVNEKTWNASTALVLKKKGREINHSLNTIIDNEIGLESISFSHENGKKTIVRRI